MCKDLGLVDKLPRMVVAQAHNANPLYRAYKTGFEKFEAIKAEPTLPPPSRLAILCPSTAPSTR